MIDTKSTVIVVESSVFNLTEEKEIIKNVDTILKTVSGTVALDRSFGIDISYLDKPMHIQKGLISVEFIKKIRKYEQRCNISEILFEENYKTGVITPKVVVQLVKT